LIIVRNNGFFEEKSRGESLKVCGNCRRVRFCLSREDQKLLNEMIGWHGAELMCSWLKKGIVMVSGGHRVDQQKTNAVKIIIKNPAICSAEGVQVFWPESACSLWLPRINTSDGH